MQGREESYAHPSEKRALQRRSAQRMNPDDTILCIIDGSLSKIYEDQQKHRLSKRLKNLKNT
jgi:hypothetical protein